MPTLTENLESLLGVKKNPSPEEEALFRKTQDFIRFLRWIPGLRLVAVSNSLAMYATHRDSDIDLFIITAPKRLWIVRTLVLLIAEILRVRTEPGNEAGKFCFPFFMTEKNLSIKNIAIKNDLYLAYWIQSLKPIFNKNYTYGRFMRVNQIFSENTLWEELSEEENAVLLKKNRAFLLPTGKYRFMKKMEKLLSPILSLKNKFLGFVSKKSIAKKIPTKETEGIIMSDDMLKLHFTDRREEIRDQVLSEWH